MSVDFSSAILKRKRPNFQEEVPNAAIRRNINASVLVFFGGGPISSGGTNIAAVAAVVGRNRLAMFEGRTCKAQIFHRCYLLVN